MLNKIILFITIILLLNAALTTTALVAEFRSCTREHLEEAITLNNERQPLYAALSNNQSIAISSALIEIEHKLLRMAILSDVVSYFYQKAGVPLLCDEYVSMSLTPKFSEKSAQPWPKLKTLNYQICLR